EQAGEAQERRRPVLQVLFGRALERRRGHRGSQPLSVAAADPGDNASRALQRHSARAGEREQLHREHHLDLPGAGRAQPAPDNPLLSPGARQRRDQHRHLLGAHTPASGGHGHPRVSRRQRRQDHLRGGRLRCQLFPPALRRLLPQALVQGALV
ncbi:MAG: hypothetical protein AVDCRST_MAG05-3426, partial [uncultured Rubrobacteraceae bacterium]